MQIERGNGELTIFGFSLSLSLRYSLSLSLPLSLSIFLACNLSNRLCLCVYIISMCACILGVVVHATKWTSVQVANTWWVVALHGCHVAPCGAHLSYGMRTSQTMCNFRYTCTTVNVHVLWPRTMRITANVHVYWTVFGSDYESIYIP